MTSFSPCKAQPVYTAPAQPRGFTWERWEGADAGGSTVGDVAGWETSWSGPVVDGVPGHVNGAPTVSGVETDTSYSQQDNTGATDDSRLCYWVWNDRDVPILLEDTDTRAESWRVYAGCDCPASVVHEQYQNDTGPSTSLGPFLTLPPGAFTKLTVLIHDPGPDFSGFWLRATEQGDTTFFDPVTFQERPTVGCEVKTTCDLDAGETVKPITLGCYDCAASGRLDEAAVQALLPIASDDTPMPDNETDTAIRTGTAGTSAEFARADHHHPIRRQANPGDPVVTPGGNATITQSIVLDRWSTEETYEYALRIRVTQPAGTGWGWVNIPTIAGFQQPQIYLGTYRNDSQAPQTDAGTGTSTDGASPRGPVMSHEAHHWSSTRRLYMAYFRRDEAITSQFIEPIVRYIRL